MKPESNLKLRHIVENLSLNPGAEIVRYGRLKSGVLSLGQGEGDLATPEFIIRAAEKAMMAGKTFYGPVLGHDELRQEIASYYARVHNVSIPSQRVFVTGSGTTAMHLALTAILDEDDEAVAVTPIWKNLLGAVELAEATVREVPLRTLQNTLLYVRHGNIMSYYHLHLLSMLFSAISVHLSKMFDMRASSIC